MSRAERARRARDAAPRFAALGDPTRLQLVERLGDGQPRPVTSLARGFRMSRQAVSKHLAVLEAAGLLRREQVGRESRYSIEPDAVAELQAYLDRVARQWDDALARLRAHVEN